MSYPQKRAPGGGLRQPSQKTWVTVAKKHHRRRINTPYRWLRLLLLLLLTSSYFYYHTEAGTVAKKMTSFRPSQKTWVSHRKWGREGGLRPTGAKKHGYTVAKKRHRRRKHTLPMQKTWPAVAKKHALPPGPFAKNTRHRCKKHLPRVTVAKNTKN